MKNDRDERDSQRKLQDPASESAIRTSANHEESRRSGQKKKIKPAKMSHSVGSGQRK